MWHVGSLSRPLAKGYVQCTACEHWCTVAPGESGKCGVQRNLDGKLRLVVYGKAAAVHIDPIEKKPLHHFLPGTSVFSLGTVGCNLACAWCQNWEISQHKHFDLAVNWVGEDWSPDRIVARCVGRSIPSIACTYNEPAVYFEYACDTCKLARAAGLRTVLVTSGFETIGALEVLSPDLDAANVDLKAFSPETYRRYCGARLAPVLRNIRHLAALGVWVEVTTLVIPGLNDSDAELGAIADFLVGINPALPWHVLGFHPDYKMLDRPSTSAATLRRAWEIGRRAGLHHVYAGNVWNDDALVGCSDTYCSRCGTTVIRRLRYRTQVQWDEAGVCPRCSGRVEGVWR